MGEGEKIASPPPAKAWGEKWCCLGFHAQKRQRYHSAMMLFVSASVFGAFHFPTLAITCMSLLCYMFLRMLWMHVEGQLGWLFAFLESIVNNTALACLLILTASKHGLLVTKSIIVVSRLRCFSFSLFVLPSSCGITVFIPHWPGINYKQFDVLNLGRIWPFGTG